MSTALSILAAATTAPDAPSAEANVHPLLMWLLAAGTCVTVACVVRRIMRPAKLSLSGTPGRPNVVNPVVLFILYLALFVLGLGAASGLLLFLPNDSAGLFVGTLLIAQPLWLLLCLVAAHYTFEGKVRRGLGLSGRHWLYDSLRGTIAYLAVLPICYAVLLFSEYALENWLPQLHRHMQENDQLTHRLFTVLREPSWLIRGGVVVSAVVLAPLTEEVFFRGMIQSMVRRYTGRPWAGIAVASVLFTIVHEPQWQNMPALLVLSIVLGYNYERSGRLLGPIVTHALFNAVFLGVNLIEHG